MAQDIKKLFENEVKTSNDKMPNGHETRFLKKLDEALPEQSIKRKFSVLNIAASVIILLGLSFSAYQFLSNTGGEVPTEISTTTPSEGQTKSIGEVSPQLKKVEDYYLASINLELSKMKVTPETKELFDGYLQRLEELNKEYELLVTELVESGPNEQTINASIENLKLRLNLMYRLKEKLSELNNSKNII
ncbi:hypothetical protein D7030_11580 [Flavobacteriaceae bacterium AU392]|nr:hypothetical protein D1817_13090 [Flavobacteriaceae bacterium]RKM82794.1 hypothetical protein D7030_11580 [Flavobacteriaceae bacterium AU392]